MPRTPVEQAIYDAERPVYDAAAALDKLLTQAYAFRSGLEKIRLPIEAANDRLDHSDDMLAILISQLNSAATIIEAEVERLQAPMNAAWDAKCAARGMEAA